MEKFFVVKGIKLPPISYDHEGNMDFFTALMCYVHLFPYNVELEEINDYDIENPPRDKLVIHVTHKTKWDGYEIFFPVYTNIQCKYCSETVNREITTTCQKLGVKEIFRQLTSDFAQMMYNMFNIKITRTPTFFEEFTKDNASE